MSEILNDTMFYYAVAFVLFMAIAYKFGRKPALGWIDGEIAKINDELGQARQLRAEADALLAECKTKQSQAEADAVAIVEQAKRQVAEMRAHAEADLATYLARQEQLAAERIAMAQNEAIASVRIAAVDQAIAIARDTIAKTMTQADAQRLIDEGIGEARIIKSA